MARPERFATLTMVGDDWQQVRGRMKRLSYALRASLGQFWWCWHVEPNPAGTGHHVHLWQRGSYMPQRLLSAAARRQGCGQVADVRRWRAPPGAAVAYGLKSTGVFYGVKGATDPANMATYLDANGNRLAHATRGWWLLPDGSACGQRAAMDAWRRAKGSDDPGPWELVSEGTAGVLGALLSTHIDDRKSQRVESGTAHASPGTPFGAVGERFLE